MYQNNVDVLQKICIPFSIPSETGDAVVLMEQAKNMDNDVVKRDLKEVHSDDRHFVFRTGMLFFVAAILVSVAGMLLSPIPVRDVASRYAPMADAFASGNMFFAFHPRIPLLHPLIGGIIAFLTGLNGYRACQIASILFFALTVFPLLALFKRVAEKQSAAIACALYVLCPYLVELAFGGMRDSLKSFVIVLLAYGMVAVYQERRSLSGYVIVGLATGLGLMTRVEMAAIGILVLASVCILEIRGTKNCMRSVLSLVTFIIFAVPQSCINFKMVGIFLPEFRLGIVFEELLHVPPVPAYVGLAVLVAIPVFCIASYAIAAMDRTMSENHSALLRIFLIILTTALISAVFLAPAPDVYERMHFIHQLAKGIYAPYAAVSVIMVLILLASKEWKGEYTILLSLLFVHDVACILQIWTFDHFLYVSDRYLISAAPLHFIFAGMFIALVFDLFKAYPMDGRFAREIKVIPALSVFVFIVVMLLLSLWPVGWKSLSPKWSGYNDMLFEAADMVKNDWKGSKLRSLDNVTDDTYRSCREPGVFFPRRVDKGRSHLDKISSMGYLSDGRIETCREEADYAFVNVNHKIMASDELPSDEWAPMKTFSWEGGIYVLYKRVQKK